MAVFGAGQDGPVAEVIDESPFSRVAVLDAVKYPAYRGTCEQVLSGQIGIAVGKYGTDDERSFAVDAAPASFIFDRTEAESAAERIGVALFECGSDGPFAPSIDEAPQFGIRVLCGTQGDLCRGACRQQEGQETK